MVDACDVERSSVQREQRLLWRALGLFVQNPGTAFAVPPIGWPTVISVVGLKLFDHPARHLLAELLDGQSPFGFARPFPIRERDFFVLLEKEGFRDSHET
jgi:hypothetical protein